jgi:integrase/recombinase XerC
MSMKAQTDEYLAQRRAEGVSKATLANYRYRFRSIARFLQAHAITCWRDVTPKHLDRYVAELKRRRFAFRSRQALLAAARCFFAWLAARGKILADPASHLVLADSREDQAPLERPLSEEEVAELFALLPSGDALDLRNRALVELLYSAGLRLGESLSLNVRDVDMTTRVVHVRRGKGGKARDIPMVGGLHKSLTKYLRVRRTLLNGADHGALILSQYGNRLTGVAVEKLMQKWSQQPGRPRLHPHRLRHAIAVHLLRNGTDIRYLQAFLGHELLDTTKIYLRLVPADIRDAYDKAMPEMPIHE